ncbi:MAG: LysR family transcriptional regulator [Verrucomicrobia bacterium]|nr:LysR family transcriptional regulator [Verrucomicrobiota bacterium]
MDLRHLRYFQAIAEDLSFSSAARRLNVVQPALSRALKELEAELGVELLARTRRSARLTPAGRILLDETSLMFERLEQAVRRVRRAAEGQEGELRLGYIGPPTRRFLGPLLEEFGRRCPRVTVHLEERTPERVWEMVARGRLHVGLTRPVLAHAALQMQTHLLRDERLCAAIPRGHEWWGRRSLLWRQLAGRPLIVLARREGAGSHDEILAGCRQAGFSPKLLHTPSVVSTILRYVEGGVGIGIVPESLGDTESSDRWSLLPLTPSLTIPLVMVWKEEHAEPPVTAFRTLVTDWLRAGRL